MAIRSRIYSDTGNELPVPQTLWTKRYDFLHCRLQFYKVIKLKRDDGVHLKNTGQSILDI